MICVKVLLKQDGGSFLRYCPAKKMAEITLGNLNGYDLKKGEKKWLEVARIPFEKKCENLGLKISGEYVGGSKGGRPMDLVKNK